MVNKQTGQTLVPCVCYLPPENSSRPFDVNNFYDKLLTDYYLYQNIGIVFICGDFNSRCGNFEDFIVGVDSIPQRFVIDTKCNHYGELFVDFLINTNMCMLNGRFDKNDDDFTSVSTKGCSVVDYCVTPHDSFSSFSKFKVISVSDLISSIPDLHQFATSGVPDHSLLVWSVVTDSGSQSDSSQPESHFDKFDFCNIPASFMCDTDTINTVNDVIVRLEDQSNSQSSLDSIYDEWCSILKTNMYDKVPYKKIVFTGKPSRLSRKAWWNETLSALWSEVTFAERKWLKTTSRGYKAQAKAIFVAKRKYFDRQVQRSKRKYWYEKQYNMDKDCKSDQSQFWKNIGKIGVKSVRKCIPMEIVNADGSTTTSIDDVLERWKTDFSSLFNVITVDDNQNETLFPDYVSDEYPVFNEDISILEVKHAVESANRGRAPGFDTIPVEVLNNDISVAFLHVLFNACFSSGRMPSVWGKCVINPIPKASSADARDPLSYRGISLASSMYKMYCSILNERLTKWAEENSLLVDEQNGFRKKRSTIDHISSLTSIIETRKKLNMSTYCAFIDFKKAYDSIDRFKLWRCLSDTGVSGKLFTSVRSLYTSVSSCVRVNSHHTDWFNVSCGLRQGCILSPLLFNFYINDLALLLKATGIGVDCDDDLICILMYADDIVLLADSEHDLQILLDSLSSWCAIKSMNINTTKSNIVHFRKPSVDRTNFIFTCGGATIDTVDSYVYLGVLLTEYLDYSKTAKYVAQSASRALGLVIAKCKSAGGYTFNVFTKLYESIVLPVICYSSCIWGVRNYSCINAVQNRAMRFYLGLGKYAPNDAIIGDMGWTPVYVSQWTTVVRHLVRMSCTTSSRLNKRVALWAASKSSGRCQNLFYIVRNTFLKYNITSPIDISSPISPCLVSELAQAINFEFQLQWITNINSTVGPSGKGKNKLRSYCLFKSQFETESYCTLVLSRFHRASLAKFRCGVAPLRVETGRYENIPFDSRICPVCTSGVETETHVLLTCNLYDDIRSTLFAKATLIDEHFIDFSMQDKVNFILSNNDMIRCSAKACFDILKRRNFYLCK